jgi:hypothetical protein
MAQTEPPWLKHLEVWSTVIGALGSVAVPALLWFLAERLGEQQHQIDVTINERSLVISTVAYVVDDSPLKREAGFKIIEWLRNKGVEIPPDLITVAATSARTQLPTARPRVPTDSATDATSSRPLSPQESVAQTASDALGGLVPRIFIQIASSDQHKAAEDLRGSLQQMTASDGRLIIAPGVQLVPRQPPLTHVELRYLKRADQAEAQELKKKLDALLGTGIDLKDLSSKYDAKPEVKRRTYELWFPPGPISLNPAAQ